MESVDIKRLIGSVELYRWLTCTLGSGEIVRFLRLRIVPYHRKLEAVDCMYTSVRNSSQVIASLHQWIC